MLLNRKTRTQTTTKTRQMTVTSQAIISLLTATVLACFVPRAPDLEPKENQKTEYRACDCCGCEKEDEESRFLDPSQEEGSNVEDGSLILPLQQDPKYFLI